MKVIIHIILVLFSAGKLFAAGNKPIDPDLESKATNFIKNKPVQFVENKGQMTDMNGTPVPFVLFRAEAPGINLFITKKGLTYCFYKIKEEVEEKSGDKDGVYDYENEKAEAKWSRIDMDLKDATIKRENIITEGKSEYFNQYFLGHCPNGIADVHSFKKVTIKEVYPGIDWVFYNSDEKGFKYDFIVQPGADPDKIELIYSSLEGLKIDEGGNIYFTTPEGEFIEQSPISFQDDKEVAAHFIKESIIRNGHSGYDSHIKFFLNKYDPSKILVIDPKLVWATSYGGAGADGPQSADCDSNGNLYISGYTQQFNGFPTQVHTGNPASYYNNSLGPNGGGIARNVFILKFNNAGVLIWGTYYASTGADWATGYSIKTDPFGNVFVVGTAGSIPTQAHTGNPLAYFNNINTGGFILKFDNMGNRIWATYYPNCNPQSVTTDASGNVYVTGSAGAAFSTQPFPGNPLAYNQTVFGGGNDAFILKFSNVGNLLWASYFGGSNGEGGLSVFTDTGGNIYMGGQTSSTDFPLRTWGSAYNQIVNAGNNDGFLVRFNSIGTLTWSTYYGGSGVDKIITVRTDTPGNIVAVGLSGSTNLPVQVWGAAYYQPSNAGNDDEFILRFDAAGVRTWATYYGGAGIEDNYSGDNLEIDDCGNIYMGFGAYSLSSNIYTFDPGCSNYYQGSHGGSRDCFYAKFNSSGVIQWATYWGGAGSDFATAIAVDKQGNMFITGEISGATAATGYPFTNPGSGAYYDNLPNTNDDAYVAKFTPVIPTYTKSQASPVGCACGNATIQVNCGTPPFNYRWSNGSQLINTSNVTNSIGLCGGNYWVEVTDGTCNRDTIFYTLTGPSNGLTLTVTHIDPSTCTGSASGTATATVTGGATPYTYLWSNGQAVQIATGLAAGNYIITVTDNSGCTTSQAVSIILPKLPSGNVVGTNIDCNITGGATVALNSGTPPFTYTWSNSQTGPVITNLSAGTYSVTVTDSKGCTMTRSVSITGSIPSSATFTQSPGGTICVGTAVTFTNTGTTGTYAWSITPITPAVSGTTVNFSYTFLTAGTFTVSHTVTTSGCNKTVTSAVSVVNCSNPTVTAVGSSMCPGFCANVTSNAIGGVAPYTYSWNSGATTPTINTCPVSTTTYTVTIRDATGKTSTSSAAITVNPAVTVTITATNITCSGGTGSADAVVGSGSPSYSYNWSNGSGSGFRVSGLSAGNYTVTVTDSKGCTNTATTAITAAAPLAGQFTKGTANCAGCGCKEWVMINATGGASPYSYSWPDGYVNRYKNQLCPGTYTVNIVDKNGCSVNVNLSAP